MTTKDVFEQAVDGLRSQAQTAVAEGETAVWCAAAWKTILGHLEIASRSKAEVDAAALRLAEIEKAITEHESQVNALQRKQREIEDALAPGNEKLKELQLLNERADRLAEREQGLVVRERELATKEDRIRAVYDQVGVLAGQLKS